MLENLSYNLGALETSTKFISLSLSLLSILRKRKSVSTSIPSFTKVAFLFIFLRQNDVLVFTQLSIESTVQEFQGLLYCIIYGFLLSMVQELLLLYNLELHF